MHTLLHGLALATALALPSEIPQGDDARELAQMPPAVVETLRQEMRNHTVALAVIFAKMSGGQLQEAGDMAEKHLGTSSMGKHRGSGDGPGRYMPDGMRAMALDMHRSATRFADLARRGEREGAQIALVGVLTQCAACHAAYRVR